MCSTMVILNIQSIRDQLLSPDLNMQAILSAAGEALAVLDPTGKEDTVEFSKQALHRSLEAVDLTSGPNIANLDGGLTKEERALAELILYFSQLKEVSRKALESVQGLFSKENLQTLGTIERKPARHIKRLLTFAA